jgi:hydrogenase maturation protease
MNETTDRTIVLGVGNPLMQDDGVGVEVVRRLSAAYRWPQHVRLIDGGVAGFGWFQEIATAQHLLIVDAVRGDQPPGTVYRLTPSDLKQRRGPTLSAHDVGVSEVLGMAEMLGKLPRTLILGVQPAVADTPGMELTALVRQALPGIVNEVLAELQTIGVTPTASA